MEDICSQKKKIFKQTYRKQKYPSYQDFQLFVKPTFKFQQATSLSTNIFEKL